MYAGISKKCDKKNYKNVKTINRTKSKIISSFRTLFRVSHADIDLGEPNREEFIVQ